MGVGTSNGGFVGGYVLVKFGKHGAHLAVDRRLIVRPSWERNTYDIGSVVISSILAVAAA